MYSLNYDCLKPYSAAGWLGLPVSIRAHAGIALDVVTHENVSTNMWSRETFSRAKSRNKDENSNSRFTDTDTDLDFLL